MSCLSLQDLSEHDLEDLLREEAQREIDPVYMGANPLDGHATSRPSNADTPTYAELAGQLEWALRRIRTSLDTGTMYASCAGHPQPRPPGVAERAMNRHAPTGESPSIILATLGGMLFGSLATLDLLMFIAQVVPA